MYIKSSVTQQKHEFNIPIDTSQGDGHKALIVLFVFQSENKASHQFAIVLDHIEPALADQAAAELAFQLEQIDDFGEDLCGKNGEKQKL
jgi:septal ring factor EnvC (AmiA/AmiB activator)